MDQVMNNTSTILRQMTQLRTFMHMNIYNEQNIELLINCINKDSDLVSIQDIDISRNIITLKIKKMNMKKLPLYNNNVMFYYDIISSGFISFITNNINVINKSNNSDIINLINSGDLYNTNYINLLYNINIIDDTSILLYL